MFETYEILIQNLLKKQFILKIGQETFPNSFSSEVVFQDIPKEILDVLSNIKEDLNGIKTKIHKIVKKYGRVKWLSYTAFTHPMKNLPKSILDEQQTITLCTQAYCKFVEILIKYPKLSEFNGKKKFRTLHLCEAPGAFVSALSDYLNKLGRLADWDFRMNSLNPYHEWNNSTEMFTDDQFIGPNFEKSIFGNDDSGNIFNWDAEFLTELIQDEGKFDLITADGSLDCQDNPDEQETIVFPLIKKEIEIALGLLLKGGNLVLKMFTLFDKDTLKILLQIEGLFKEIFCYKPSSSKPGNSEMYVLCFDYNEKNLNQTKIYKQKLEKIVECAKFYADFQMEFMEFNLQTFNRLSKSQKASLEIQKCTAINLLKNFILEHISSTDKESIKNIPKRPFDNPWQLQWNNKVQISQKMSFSLNENLSLKMNLLPYEMDHVCEKIKLNGLNEFLVFAKKNEKTKIIHSLFANSKLLFLNYEKIFDLCEFAGIKKEIKKLSNENFILKNNEFDAWNMTKSDWISLLNQICYGNSLNYPILKINFLPKTLLLSRFTASLLFCLGLMYNTIEIKKKFMEFSGKNLQTPLVFSAFLNQLEKKVSKSCSDDKKSKQLLQFIPIVFFSTSNFYAFLTEFNNEKLLKIQKGLECD